MGTELRPTLDAAAVLAGEGIAARVVDMHTLKPIDAAEIRAAAAETGAVLTVEEHNVIGGLGPAVAELLVDGPRVPFRRHGVPANFVEVGPPDALYAPFPTAAPGNPAHARERVR